MIADRFFLLLSSCYCRKCLFKSKKNPKPQQYSFIRVEIFLTSRVWHSFATSVQDWLGCCPGKYCMHASTSVPRCTSRHLWHRGGSFPAPTESSTGHWGWESAFPSNTSLGKGAVLDPTAKQPSCWQNSQALLNGSGWANDLLHQLCGIYFYFHLLKTKGMKVSIRQVFKLCYNFF